MAESVLHSCGSCHRTIEAWSDGNPYNLDENGDKKYAYHPNHELLEHCIGNDSPFLCLACGREFMVDSESPIDSCPNCTSPRIADELDLDGLHCPYCKAGVFTRGQNHGCIS